MIEGFSLVIKTLGSLIIEFLLFLCYLVCIAYIIELTKIYFPDFVLFIRIVLFGIFITYLLFSNTKFKSLSAIILHYTFKDREKKTIKIMCSNFVLYGLFSLFIWLQVTQKQSIFAFIVSVLFLVEMMTCFFPRIGTRLSYHFLQLQIEKVIKKIKEEDKIVI